MRKPATYDALARLGRVQLSRHFYMRNFLNSEIGNFYGVPNLPDDPDLAIAAGTRLAENLLEPIVETFGPIEIRSGHRSPEINAFGNRQGHQCARNEATFANHIWDRRDSEGRMGACVSVVIPWFAAQYNLGRDWRDLAWWLHDHIPHHAVWFFPLNAAFNLTWREEPEHSTSSYIAPKGYLVRPGVKPGLSQSAREGRYSDFPTFRGIKYPAIPATTGL
ncbi:MAG: hypothetical protein AAGF71_11330 [Pseudomonadota bacterium]